MAKKLVGTIAAFLISYILSNINGFWGVKILWGAYIALYLAVSIMALVFLVQSLRHYIKKRLL